MSKSYNVTLSQSVSNPVGCGENTDQGEKRNAPSQDNSGSVVLSQSVINPVGNAGNTGRGYQEPLPMRPIPS